MQIDRHLLNFVYFQLRQAEMEIKKGENMLEHEKEIFSRPARTWFQNAKDKQAAKGV